MVDVGDLDRRRDRTEIRYQVRMAMQIPSPVCAKRD